MTHLERWVSALVDGRLRPDVAERAHVHLAACPDCRRLVAAEREVRGRLREAPVPAASDELVARLLALGGPQGPFPPLPPPRVPGGPEPAPAVAWQARRGSGGDRRGRAVPVAVAALSVVSLGLLGLMLLGSTLSRPAPGSTVVAAGTTTSVLPGGDGEQRTAVQSLLQGNGAAVNWLDRSERELLRDQGWICPEALPGGLRLVEARSVPSGGLSTVQLTYSDGTSTVSLVEQRGELGAGDGRALAEVMRLSAGPDDAVGWHGLWQNGDVVIGVVADAAPETLARVLPALLSDR